MDIFYAEYTCKQYSLNLRKIKRVEMKTIQIFNKKKIIKAHYLQKIFVSSIIYTT